MPAKPNHDQPSNPAADFREQVKSLSFEEAVEQLEDIIDRIESGQIGLEQSLVEYERGVALRDHCRTILARAEQRVTELAPDAPARDDR
jgi:exodeoxyribonuclease VII small subunit